MPPQKPHSIDIVLVRPLYAGNVGSVARAMLNCGLEQLVVVEPPWNEWPDDAFRMASGADAVLHSARRASSMAEALGGYVLAAATTARARAEGPQPITHREAAPRLKAATRDGPVAVVFGPEDRGLSTEELDACALRIRVPTSPLHSSLNLSQAVLLVAHELYMVDDGALASEPAERATLEELEGFLGQLQEILGDVGFLNPQNPRHIMDVMRAVFLRAQMDPREARTFRGMCRQVRWALDSRGKPGS
jgi:TrmH family RNA methyltransferase